MGYYQETNMEKTELYYFLRLLLDFHITNNPSISGKDEKVLKEIKKDIRNEFIMARKSLDLYLK